MASLKDQTVIITGAGRGIGRAMTAKFAAAGAHVYAAARSEDELAAAARDAAAAGVPGTVTPVPTDVTDPRQVDQLVKRVLEDHGRVDVLINNAGTGLYAPVEELTPEQWDRMMAVNLKGPFLCCRAVLPSMKERRRGLIINVASVAGLTTFPGGSAYCASKWGVMALTDTLRQEVRPYELKVTAICPGSVQTDFAGTPAKSYSLEPDDVAEVALFMAEAPRRVILNQAVMRPLVPLEFQSERT